MDHFKCRVSHCRHGQTADQKRKNPPEEHPGQHYRIVDLQAEIGDVEDHRLDVRRDEGKCCQGRRTNGKTLTDGRGRVAQFIQGIGDLADLLTQTSHLGDTTGIIRYRSVRIDGHRDADGREHSDRRDTDPVESGKPT